MSGAENARFNQDMRRQYVPLMQQKRLMEIEEVAAAMKLDLQTTAKLKHWHDIYSKKVMELDRPPTTEEDVVNRQRQLLRLNFAKAKAQERLLGDKDDEYNRLLSAASVGLLSETLHRDPNAPKPEVIPARTHLSRPVDTSAYDSLFK